MQVARPEKDVSAEKNEHTVQVRARVRGPLTARHASMADDVEVFHDQPSASPSVPLLGNARLEATAWFQYTYAQRPIEKRRDSWVPRASWIMDHGSCIVAICMGRAGQDVCRICSASGRGGSPDSPREPAIRYPRVPDLPRAAESAHRCGRTDARRMNTGRPVQSAAGGRGNSPLRPFSSRAPGMAACAGLTA